MKFSQQQIALLAMLAVGVPLLGALLGFVAGSRPDEIGTSLGAPPEPIAQLAHADYVGLTVQTTGGNYFRCPKDGFMQGAACWERTAPPAEIAAPPTISLIDNAKFAPPPGKTRELWVETFSSAISGTIDETRYALLEDGTVWVWRARANTWLNPPKSLDQMFGAGVGFCCALLPALVLVLGFIFTRATKNKTLVT